MGCQEQQIYGKPVDAGYPELLKVKERQAHYQWLDSDENADKWYNISLQTSAFPEEMKIARVTLMFKEVKYLI